MLCHNKSASNSQQSILRQNSELPRHKSTASRSSKYNMLVNSVCIALVSISLAVLASASYQLPIQQRIAPVRHRQHQQQQQHASLQQAPLIEDAVSLEPSNRRSDEDQQQQQQQRSAEPVDESEQLRQLHRAVDTVAQLLNEEERQQASSQAGRNARNNGEQQAHDLISESAIRQAIEELEKVQQQERQAAISAESRQTPALAEPAPQPEALQAKQSNIEGLIDEMGDSFIDDQLVAASQDAERMIRHNQQPREKVTTSQPVPDSRQQPVNPVKLAPPYTSTALPNNQQRQENSTTTDQSSLLVGQLDSLTSELGPALTNDFYTFHAEATGSDRREPVAPNQDESSNLKRDYANANAATSENSDLATSAQTRNTVTQRDPNPQPNFPQDSGTIRFDFSQPTNFEAQQPRLTQQQANQEALVRAFRQQTGANDNQFPTSTLLPLPNPDNFWRPTSNLNQNSNEDIGQQYNRARDIQQGLPQLPPSRFQSAPPASQFSQSSASSRQPQHIHYTGHSIIPSNEPQQFPPQPLSSSNGRNAPLSSTSAPMISVLSGSDTSSGSSVTWNPPATLNPPAPAQQVFNQPFVTSTQSSPPSAGEPMTQFFPNPNRGPASPLFRGSFQGNPEASQIPPQNFRLAPVSNFPESTEANPPESTTEERFPPTTTQWSPPTSSQPVLERDVSDSQPRSSIRTLQSNQPFFSPNELSMPTSTSQPVNTDPPRVFRNNVSTTTTSTTLAPPPLASTNTTKKEDMVIYYYYYYDDNKNATVVAKNVSSTAAASSPVPLDAAIEADGGVEDTPYMEDPAPIANLRTQTNQPSSTTTSTTTTSSLPPLVNNFESTTSRSRVQSGSSRSPILSDPTEHSRQSQFDRGNQESSGSADLFKQPAVVQNQNFKQLADDHQRLPTSHNRQQSRLPVQEVSSSTQASFVPPQVPSIKPGNRITNNFDSTANNRFVSTEASRVPVAKAELTSRQPVSAPTPANSKLQADLIKDVLNGVSNALPRQQTSSSTVQPSTSTNGSRGPLSNASRYGTNNNLVMDPYGLDPAAPATLGHSTHPSAVDHMSNQHHKSWQQSGAQNSIHQSARKPTPVTDVPVISSSSTTENQPIQKMQSSSTTRSASNASAQHFSSQRNSNSAPAHSTPTHPASGNPTAIHPTAIHSASTHSASAHPASVHPAPVQSVSAQPSPARVSTQVSSRAGANSNAQSVTTNRQAFPESASMPFNEFSNVPVSEAPQRITHLAPKQALHDQPTPTLPKIQATRQSPSNAIDLASNKLISSLEDSQNFNKESSRIQSNNGRPSTPDGNTGNGFTRSPLQSTTAAPAVVSTSSPRVQTSTTERKLVASSTPQSIMSTSVSKSFVTPQQVQVTTSVSAPTITSSPSSTVSSTSQSTAPSTPAPQTTVSNQPSTSSTSSSQESSSTTESADSANTSTRKKFGNRNNRFQTRLSANAARSSTTTTSTTSAPSVTSTTRRPTSTTTRKTSKQLFAGRRRLSSPSSSSSTSSSSTSSTSSSSGSASITPTATDTANASPVITSTSSVSTVVETSSSPPVPLPNRSRFGGSTSLRGRLSTAAPSSPEPSGSTQKPSLFVSRPSVKPRLPFMKGNKPSNGISESEGSNLPQGTVVTSTNSTSESLSTNSIDKVADNISETSEEASGETSASGPDSEIAEIKKETPLPVQLNSTLAVESTPAPSPPASSSQTPEAGRNKPKLTRPLFTSRQRNSSLFGNRRNSTSTS